MMLSKKWDMPEIMMIWLRRNIETRDDVVQSYCHVLQRIYCDESASKIKKRQRNKNRWEIQMREERTQGSGRGKGSWLSYMILDNHGSGSGSSS